MNDEEKAEFWAEIEIKRIREDPDYNPFKSGIEILEDEHGKRKSKN